MRVPSYLRKKSSASCLRGLWWLHLVVFSQSIGWFDSWLFWLFHTLIVLNVYYFSWMIIRSLFRQSINRFFHLLSSLRFCLGSILIAVFLLSNFFALLCCCWCVWLTTISLSVLPFFARLACLSPVFHFPYLSISIMFGRVQCTHNVGHLLCVFLSLFVLISVRLAYLLFIISLFDPLFFLSVRVHVCVCRFVFVKFVHVFMYHSCAHVCLMSWSTFFLLFFI